MAIKSTIHKVDIQITNTDIDYYESHRLTVASHPSETDERLMVRLLAFAINANSEISFAGDISEADEPAIWEKSLSGQVKNWIELGQPDEKIIRKACNNSRKVIIYCFNTRRSQTWFDSIRTKVNKFNNLEIWLLPDEGIKPLAGLVQRNMQLVFRIQDGEIWISQDDIEVHVVPEIMLQRN